MFIKMICLAFVFVFFAAQAEGSPVDSILLPLENQEHYDNEDLLRGCEKGPKFLRGKRGRQGRPGATGPTGPTGATGAMGPSGSSAVAAFALYYAKISQIIDAATVGSPLTAGLVEFEQNPPDGSDPLHSNVNVGGFTISSDDATFPTLITSITVPLSGYYRITVILSTAGTSQIALVKNIGPVTAGSFPFKPNLRPYIALQ